MGFLFYFGKTCVTELFIPRERIRNEHNVIWQRNKLVTCRITRSALYNLGLKMDGVL